MGRNPTERTPNLFSAAAVGDSPAPPKLPGTEAATEIASQRHVLPKNLRNAVKHLSDGELDLMYAATLEEMKRRGRTPQGVETGSSAGPDLTNTVGDNRKTTTCRYYGSPFDSWSTESCSRSIQGGCHTFTDRSTVRNFPIECAQGFVVGWNEAVNHMTIKAHLAELERQHKALEHEIAEALAHSSTDDLKITELKRRKLILKDEIERVRHDHAL